MKKKIETMQQLKTKLEKVQENLILAIDLMNKNVDIDAVEWKIGIADLKGQQFSVARVLELINYGKLTFEGLEV